MLLVIAILFRYKSLRILNVYSSLKIMPDLPGLDSNFRFWTVNISKLHLLIRSNTSFIIAVLCSAKDFSHVVLTCL